MYRGAICGLFQPFVKPPNVITIDAFLDQARELPEGLAFEIKTATCGISSTEYGELTQS